MAYSIVCERVKSIVCEDLSEGLAEMREFLEEKYGGNWEGQMTNVTWATKEDDCELPHRGRMFQNTTQNLNREGYDVSFERTDRSIAFYSDMHGNPCLYLEGCSVVCDHGDPNHYNNPICWSCASMGSSMSWEGDDDDDDVTAKTHYKMLPVELRGECWSCREMMRDCGE